MGGLDFFVKAEIKISIKPARRVGVADPTGSWPLRRVSEIFVFHSGSPKIFPKALRRSIFRADRKYGLKIPIRHREDRENLK